MSLTKVSYSMTNGASVNVLDYGAIGDGLTNCTAAIQAAINAACSLNETGLSAGAVYFPRGRYLVTSTLNCTNSRVNGTLKRDGLKLFGEGVSSAILGNCGTGKAVIETTGSQYLHIEDMCIDCNNLASPASIGVLQALSSTLPQTQNQFFKCLYVYMQDMPTANANLGSICIYNFGAEENTYDTCALYGNVAVVLTSSNNGTQVGPVTLTSYQTLDTIHSLGMTTFSGECLMVGLNKRKAPLILQNITTPTFENTYIAGMGTGGSDQYAIWFAGNVTNMTYHGVIEDRSSILFSGGLFNSRLDITWGGVTASSTAALLVDRTQPNAIYNSQINVDLQANFTRAVLSTADGNESSASSYYIANSQITAFSAGGPGSVNLYVPLNVAQNPATVNVGVYGAAKQPTTSAFATGLALDQSNVTGDGTVYNLNSSPWTANYDLASALSANGVFTAPLNGVYTLSCNVAVTGIGASHTDMRLYVVVNSVIYDLNRFNPYVMSYPATTTTMIGAASIYMTAGQTATLYLSVSGSTKTVNVVNGTAVVDWRTRFEGVKVA